MASSGRVPPPVLALMARAVTVKPTTKNMYGEESGTGTGRTVQCMMQPASSVSRATNLISSESRVVLYCDDINISKTDEVSILGVKLGDIEKIETYEDQVGPMYQVVVLA